MVAEYTVRADPTAMRGCAPALSGRAEDLRGQLAELDDQVGQMLGGCRGTSGSVLAESIAW